jgi:hypothetical protein
MMRSTAPPLSLTREQASRLQAYLQTYRHDAFVSLAPSPKRNTTLRRLQGIQGKLIAIVDQKITEWSLVLTVEERTTLRTVIEELRLLCLQEKASAERDAILADLGALRERLWGDMSEKSQTGGGR